MTTSALCLLALFAAAPAPAPVPASNNALDPASPVTEVRVDRAKPDRPKHPTLRFLRENRDFLRARLDLMRATRSERPGTTDALDPRWLSYETVLKGAAAGRDTVGAADDRQSRRTLLEHIGQLSDLEAELDGMDRVLDAQAGRLGVLDQDFAGHQQTALVILLKGRPAGGLTIALEDSTLLNIALTPEQRTALANGGIAELWHGFVEPREQVIALAVEHGATPENGWMTLTPARDRLTFLEIDLGRLDATDPAQRLHAGSWVLEANPTLSAR